MGASINQRVKIFCKSQKITISAFEKKCGLSNGYVNGISRGIGSDKLKTISLNFPMLNITWLLTGDGEMFNQDNSNEKDDFLQLDKDNTYNNKLSNQYPNFYSQIEFLLEQNRNLMEQNRKAQEQIDRLISIIEKMNNKQNKGE